MLDFRGCFCSSNSSSSNSSSSNPACRCCVALPARTRTPSLAAAHLRLPTAGAAATATTAAAAAAAAAAASTSAAAAAAAAAILRGQRQGLRVRRGKTCCPQSVLIPFRSSSSSSRMEGGQRGAGGGVSQGSSGELNPSPNEELSDLTGSDLEEDVTWIEWFCGLKGNEMFVFVDEDFVRDDFNLTGLSTQVPYYDKALSLIVEGDLSDDSPSDSISFAYIEKSAALLFGLIHARFILTTKGLGLLQQKVASQFYAKSCPNALCDFPYLLPCALTDTPSLHTVKLFCARCNELYHPPRSSYLNNIDGAFFGTSVASLFFLTYPHMLPSRGPQGPLPGTAGSPLARSGSGVEDKKETDRAEGGGTPATAAAAAAAGDSREGGRGSDPVYYVPRIFGFRVHPDSRKLTLEREEEIKRRNTFLAAAAAAPAAAAAGQKQQQQQESEQWYKPVTGGASPAGEGGGPSQGAPHGEGAP
ncbi:hypothetical protein Esti_005350 [Eimeria stiedai]